MNFIICYHMLQVLFVSKKQIVGQWCTFEGQLIPYILHVFPTLPVRQIEHQYYTLTGLEISSNNGSKLLLSCCIPNTKLYLSFMKIDKFVSEVNGGHRLVKHGLVLYVLPKNGGLSYSAVSDEDDLVFGPTEGCLFGCHLIKKMDGAINIIRRYYVLRGRDGEMHGKRWVCSLLVVFCGNQRDNFSKQGFQYLMNSSYLRFAISVNVTQQIRSLIIQQRTKSY